MSRLVVNDRKRCLADCPSVADRQAMVTRSTELVIASIQYCLCVSGVLANALVCWVIVRHKRTAFSNSFYTLAVALAVPDSLHLLTELVCALPGVFYGLERTSNQYLCVCGYLADSAFWAIAPLMLMIAINRYLAVCHYNSYRRRFNGRVVWATIGFCAAFCFVVPTLMYVCTCRYRFRYAWLFECQQSGCKEVALRLNAVICNGVCIGVVAVYVLIFVQYRIARRRLNAGVSDEELRRRCDEIKLMVQFGLISSVLIVYQIIFWTLLFVGGSDVAEILLNFFVNLNSCCSPFLYLTFSSDIRSRLPWRVGRPTNVVNGRPIGDIGLGHINHNQSISAIRSSFDGVVEPP